MRPADSGRMNVEVKSEIVLLRTVPLIRQPCSTHVGLFDLAKINVMPKSGSLVLLTNACSTKLCHWSGFLFLIHEVV